MLSIKKIYRENKPYMGLIFMMLFIFYVNDDSLLFGTNQDKQFLLIKYLCYGVLALMSMRNLLQNRTKQPRLYKNVVILAFFTLMTAVLNFDITAGYAFQILVFIISSGFVLKYDFDNFIRIFEKVLYGLSLLSLIVFVSCIIVPSIPTHFPIIQNSADDSYYNMIVNFYSSSEWVFIQRNRCIFREPGMYMIYLLFGLIVNLFYMEEKNKKHIALYSICMVSTFSTAGIMLMLALFGVASLLKGNKKYLLLLGGCFAIIVFLGIENDYILQIFGKLDKDSSNYESTYSRLTSLTTPISIWFNNPLFGVGMRNFSLTYEAVTKLPSGGNATNFMVNIFATYGLIVGIIFWKATYRLGKHLLPRLRGKYILFVFILLFGAFSNEDIRYSIFFMTLLLYSFKRVNNTAVPCH